LRAGLVFTPQRLIEPDDGIDDVNAPAMFASRWPMNSWLPSMRWPDLTPTARAIEIACVSPSTVNASVNASSMYAGDPGAASGASVAITTSAIALVGPEIWCHDEPHNAATMAGTIAQ
jgi:hypothetical protein